MNKTSLYRNGGPAFFENSFSTIRTLSLQPAAPYCAMRVCIEK
jgi:hypothetical protein